jgi:hypothetical protein
MPKVLTIAGVSILALCLVLGVVLPSLAAPDKALLVADDSLAKIVKGKVTDIDEEYQEYFKIQSGEEELTISVDGNTKYYKLGVPGRIVALVRQWKEFRYQNQEGMGLGVRIRNQEELRAEWLRPFGEESAFSDIALGDRVVVWLAEDSELLAQRVLIIKPTTYASVSGSITGVSADSITITPDDGDPVTLSYNGSTVFVLNGFIAVEEGQSARAIYDSDNMIAKRVVVHQEAP